MRRLGYTRYGAQGGDTGSVVSPALGRFDPEHVVGVHSNGLAAFTPLEPAEQDGLTAAERARLAAVRSASGTGRLTRCSRRPGPRRWPTG